MKLLLAALLACCFLRTGLAACTAPQVNPKGSLCSGCASGHQCNSGSCVCNTEGSGSGAGDSCIDDTNCLSTPAPCCDNSYLFDSATKCCKAPTTTRTTTTTTSPTTPVVKSTTSSAGRTAGSPMVAFIISTGSAYFTHVVGLWLLDL